MKAILKYSLKEILDKTILTDEHLYASQKGQEYEAHPENIAFIQFSSGSTGDPKGVVLTHDNLVTNIFQMIKGSNANKDDCFLSWMPLTHDMGIIGMHLVPSMLGALQYLMPTSVFIRRPTLWLAKVDEHNITITSSPNFGYSYFLMHFKPEIAKHWDLSHVRLILNGAEPISPNLCKQFLDALSIYKLSRTAMFPVYGLAEASLGVTFPPLEEVLTTKTIKRQHLNIGEKIISNSDNMEGTVDFVDVGYPLEGLEVSITDVNGAKLEECTIGNIQIKGKNVTRGYYNNTEKTSETIQNGWLKTGDIGFIENGRLVITGRAKDIIFVNGQNIYPHDIERVAESLEEIKLGYIAACGVVNEHIQSDQIILFVLHKKDLASFIPLIKELKGLISKEMGINIHKIIPVKKLPKTTSGKIERYKLGKAYSNGEFKEIINQLDQLSNKIEHSTGIDNIIPKENNNIQGILLQLLKETFEVEHVNIYENFFELGGNSLLLTRLHERIERIYPGKIQITDLFTYTNVDKLAKYLESKDESMDIEFSPIKLPSYFLNAEHIKSENTLFQYDFDNTMSNVIVEICKENEVTIYELFLSLYISLLAKVSNQNEIMVQAILAKDEVAHSLKVELKENIDFLDLLNSIKLRDENIKLITTYSIEQVLKMKNSKDSSGIIPLFSKRNVLSTKYALLNLYGLILYVHQDNKNINLTLEYNSSILNKDSMRSFFNNYIKLVTFFTTKYIDKTKGVMK